MQNNHISEFLDYYTRLSNPQYAVLLKGKWGSGKTHFINEYKERLKTNGHKYIYASLYGVNSYDEIETKFLETIHPFLYNKKTIFAGKIVKQLLKSTLKIDWDGNGQEDAEIETKIPDFKPEDLLNTQDYILIFDDLERCSINIINLLGYINFFVEHQSYKVILIANEEELIKNEKELEKTEKYTLIKEKLIGKTFEFISDTNLAYDSFLTELKNTNNIKENILKKQKSNILELFEKSESKNLRALRQTLLDFERFYDEVLIVHFEKEELLKDILYWFFLFSLEIRQGNSDILNLSVLREEYYSLSIVHKKNKEAEETKYKLFFNKYNLDNNWDVIIPFDLWKEILLDSYIKKEDINLALKNSKYYASEETNSWKLLYNYYDLDDDTFKILTDEIYFKIYKMEYKILKEVKMVSSILLSFKEKKLIDKTDFCLEYEIKKQIDYLFDNDLIDDETILPEDMSSFYYHASSFENYGFMKSSKMDEISKYIDDKLKIKLEEKLKKDSLLIVNLIEEDNLDSLKMLLVYSTTKYVPYSDKPILKYLNVNELADMLKNSDNKTIREFFHVLNKRYDFYADALVEEKEFLNELKTKLEILSHEKNGKLSGYYFDNFCDTLDKCIEKIKKQEIQLP